MPAIQDVAARVEQIIRATLKLGNDVTLNADSDLVNEVGLDSIEAFEAMATLHDLLGVSIPDNLDPKLLASIQRIADYIVSTYTPVQVEAFLTMDFRERLASLNEDEALS